MYVCMYSCVCVRTYKIAHSNPCRDDTYTAARCTRCVHGCSRILGVQSTCARHLHSATARAVMVTVTVTVTVTVHSQGHGILVYLHLHIATARVVSDNSDGGLPLPVFWANTLSQKPLLHTTCLCVIAPVCICAFVAFILSVIVLFRVACPLCSSFIAS
jgi:hypothetical protein